MRNHADDFMPFLYLEDGDFEKYCNDVENTARWGGQLEVSYHYLIHMRIYQITNKNAL